ncbi:peptidoglycan editing factor PgeF [Desulfobulbus rhabdoformis]|uniref:peptidoglycan editing factor PgeF n=1 Tax=Desulfobulbus rhabdoformis TaxID=34032 RepID=UPI0019625A02|nr:peptidoglycan editing factor PgeF [Desulfobulbus rhabdoformis]MBM9614346.1 peptidoglycan editing factor PgeF [Desulfobulbus rhabdoformis]
MHIPEPISFYQNSRLLLPHGCFNRLGGISPSPFDTLNLNLGAGDVPNNVKENRVRALAAIGLTQLISVHQVHSDAILLANKEHIGQEPQGYDAIISDLPGVALLIQQADCQAVLLYAQQHQVIAAVHCGWRGSVQGIIGKTVQAMQEHHGVKPETLTAVISPSLGPCCAEFTNFMSELPEWMHAYQVRPFYFDFWAISRKQLEEAGVKTENIDCAAICTRCTAEYFSYRRAVQTADGVTGRNGSFIGLPQLG